MSVSEEAATALQLGPLQGKGRNEFNSSFYTVIELPPLAPDKVGEIAKRRGVQLNSSGKQLLCLLSAGNLRELIRMADGWPQPLDHDESESGVTAQLRIDQVRACRILALEAAALQREIVRAYSAVAASSAAAASASIGHSGRSAVNAVLPKAWATFPETSFGNPQDLDVLGRVVIRQSWDLASDPTWDEVIAEPWRKFLVRLFVLGRVMADMQASTDGKFTDREICDLRDVLIMAGHSASVALLMLKDRFGGELGSSYAHPATR